METTIIDAGFIKQIKRLIAHDLLDELEMQLEHIYPQDIAELIDKLDTDEARQLVFCIDTEKAVKVLVELEDDVRAKFLETYKPKDIADKFVQHMNSNDAAYILNDLKTKDKEEVVSYLTDIEFASNLLSLMSYDEHTAGSLMAIELVRASSKWTVQQCIDEIRRESENVDSIYVVYVTDKYERLVGLITLKNLILSKADAILQDVSNKNVISVPTSTDSEAIANLFDKYDLVVLPVVNALGQLVGRITVDDVVEVIKEEANEDYQLMSGITENVDATDKVWILSRARLPWLLIGLIGGIGSSRFIQIYETTLKIHPEMAFFMPLIAAMGGNVGVQSSAIVVQGLANDTLGNQNIIAKILKELRVALINGLICSLLLFAYNAIFAHSYDLSVTVSVALFSVIIFASVLGTFIPMVLHKMKIDPAIATGPFITTTNDLLGLAIYFTIGRMMYTSL